MPTPQTPFPTAPHALKTHSTSANTSNPLFNSPHALKRYFTQCQHLKPPFELPPWPQNTLHPMLVPLTPFSIAPMQSKHISHRANTSNPLFNSPHALRTSFTRCQHVKPPFQLPPCPQNTFHPVPTHQTPFPTAPIPPKHISQSASTSNPLFNCPHALKKHLSHSANTSNPLFNSPHALRTHFTQCQHHEPPFHLPPCPENIFHKVPTPQTPFPTAAMPSKHISPDASSSNPLFNCPDALKTYFTQGKNLKPPIQLTRCPQKHISTSANTSHPLFNCPHALKTHFNQCHHLKPPFQLPPCPENRFHTVPTRRTPFSTAPMPSKHISTSANTSNSLLNSRHALETYFTQCQHLEPPFQLPPDGRGPSPHGRCLPSCGTWHRRTPPQEPRKKLPGTLTPGQPARFSPGAGPGAASQWHPRQRGSASRQPFSGTPTRGHATSCRRARFSRPARLRVVVGRRVGATAAGLLGPPIVVFARGDPGPCHPGRQGGFPAAAPPRRGPALQPTDGSGLGTVKGRRRAPEPVFPPGPGPGATSRRGHGDRGMGGDRARHGMQVDRCGRPGTHEIAAGVPPPPTGDPPLGPPTRPYEGCMGGHAGPHQGVANEPGCTVPAGAAARRAHGPHTRGPPRPAQGAGPTEQHTDEVLDLALEPLRVLYLQTRIPPAGTSNRLGRLVCSAALRPRTRGAWWNSG